MPLEHADVWVNPYARAQAWRVDRTSPAAENEAFERIFERRFTCQWYSANLSILTVSARHTSE
jgi:hypothetical protein